MHALVLLSGGLDSCVALAWALERYHKVSALSFDYGQKNENELVCAEAVAAHYGYPNRLTYTDGMRDPGELFEHRTMPVSHIFQAIGNSALLGKRSVPEGRSVEDLEFEKIKGVVPSTYVPFRNGIFLSIAGAYATANGYDTVVGGWNGNESAYPDSRHTFVKQMEKAIKLGIPDDIPAFHIVDAIHGLTKSDVIQMGFRLDAPLHLTMSCYNGVFGGCQKCDACVVRHHGFVTARRLDQSRSQSNITLLKNFRGFQLEG